MGLKCCVYCVCVGESVFGFRPYVLCVLSGFFLGNFQEIGGIKIVVVPFTNSVTTLFS